MKSTVNIVRDLVNNISANVLIESAIDNGNGTYTINSSNTYWLSQYDTITIGGHEYYVNSFVQNVSFTITPTGNGVLPTVTGFSLTPPTYIHGTTKMANNEVDAIKNKMDLVPFIYLYEVLRDRKNTDEASAIERETTLRLFFLNSSSFKDMLTEDVYVNIIDPMQTMVDLFVESVRNSKFFTDNMDYEIIPLIEFSEEGNQNKSVFDCNLSGIELRLSAEIRKDLSCSGYEISPTPSCLPVRITDGLEIINVPSGLTYTCKNVVCEEVNYSILDIDGNVLYSGTKQAGETLTQTIQDSTVNVRKSDNTLIKSVSVLAEGTEDELIADSPITVNGNAFANVKATESLNIPVQYENGTPVGNIVGGVVEVPDPITPSGIAYQRPMLTGQVISYRTGDDAWTVINRPPPANPTNPVYWAELVNFTTLVNNNVFGNTNRFTDELGGQTYTNGYIIDHYTGLGWSSVRTFGDWDNSIDTPLSYIDVFGNDDYFSPNILQANSIFDNDLLGFNYAPFNTFWAYDNQFYNTSTTDKITNTSAMKVRRSDRGLSASKGNGAYGIRCRWHF